MPERYYYVELIYPAGAKLYLDSAFNETSNIADVAQKLYALGYIEHSSVLIPYHNIAFIGDDLNGPPSFLLEPQ